MAKKQYSRGGGKQKANEIQVSLGDPSERQYEFCLAKTTYIAYGGAKGGGKTWAVRYKSFGGAAQRWPGIRILIVRRTYRELEENHIRPMKAMAAPLIQRGLVSYNSQTNIMDFHYNGSMIRFGHYAGQQSEEEYQGQEYDWIFLDEATQFTERDFRYLGGCLRGVNDIPKRFYLTCNPGGVGHRWVKRLFIDKEYKTDSDNLEENEDPADFSFIPATIEDNTAMRDGSPESYQRYLQMLSSMPENVRAAYRYGDWSQLGGNYFPEFGERHIVRKTDGRYKIPGFETFVRYRAIDYGLDMAACLWVAIDTYGHCYVYREFNQGKDNQLPELIVSDAAAAFKSNTPKSENIVVTIAPPDLWSKSSTDGKSKAEIFLNSNVALFKANNDRVQGHMQVKEMLKDAPDGRPWLMIFEDCKDIISNLQDIQSDEKNPNDCAKEPHEISHNVDALRYFCISRTLPTETPQEPTYPDEDDEEEYDDFMTGGEVTASYIGYGQR